MNRYNSQRDDILQAAQQSALPPPYLEEEFLITGGLEWPADVSILNYTKYFNRCWDQEIHFQPLANQGDGEGGGGVREAYVPLTRHPPDEEDNTSLILLLIGHEWRL